MFKKTTVMILMFALFSPAMLYAKHSPVSSPFSFSLKVQPAISITLVGNMAFSAVSVPAAATDVILLPLASNTNGNGSAASFTVTGKAGEYFTASVQNATTVLGIGEALANPMSADSFLIGEGGAGSYPYIGTFGVSNTIYVGCTLHMTASQAAGDYAGSNSLLVSYN
ncbi:MAG: DUF4402 domain-containing protein [Candidatus Wallbacteria bacterium]|nr:DUF4402 domain-containing protein [Candidatus Wallbacteria bacterium]